MTLPISGRLGASLRLVGRQRSARGGRPQHSSIPCVPRYRPRSRLRRRRLADQTPFGVAEHVLPALAAQLHKAERAALIRNLQLLSTPSKVGRVVTQLGQHGRQLWTNLRTRPRYFTKALIYKSADLTISKNTRPVGPRRWQIHIGPGSASLPQLKKHRKARRTAPLLPDVLHQSGPGGVSFWGPGLTLLTNRGLR